VGGSTPAVHDGWMWDLTVPGNNDHDFYVIAGTSIQDSSHHTYYGVAGDTPVLVHNTCGDGIGRELLGGESSQHILDGHAFPGAPGKTAFPQSWSNDDILNAVADVLTDPQSQRVWKTGSANFAEKTLKTRRGDPAVQAITGTVNGVKIEVRFEPLTDTVLTAFPLP